MTDINDKFTTSIPIRHAKEPGVIRWDRRTDTQTAEQDTPPIERNGTAKAFGQSNGYQE